jgi:methyltransferase
MTLDTRVLYTLLVALVAAGRLVELRIAKRNLRRLLERGGVEAAPGHYPWMVLLHTLFLLSCPLEVWLLGRPFLPALGIPMLVLAVLATGLRYWVIRTLDGRWTTRIVVLPGVPPVLGGPYRLLRHPNYLAVITEMFALPLVHTAWITAAVFSALNAAVLRVRIRAEEEALSRMTDYGTAFAGRPRLVPGGR